MLLEENQRQGCVLRKKPVKWPKLQIRMQQRQVKWLMENLNDGEVKAAINEAWAQAAVWNDSPEGGFVYEVFVRPETIDTDSMVMKYKFVCGTRE